MTTTMNELLKLREYLSGFKTENDHVNEVVCDIHNAITSALNNKTHRVNEVVSKDRIRICCDLLQINLSNIIGK